MFYIAPALFFLVKYSQKVMKPCQPLKPKKKTKAPKKRGNTTNAMEGPTSKRTNEPPLVGRADHKGNIEFSNPPLIMRRISTKEMGGPPERTPSLDKPSPIATACFKIENAIAHCNVINTFYLYNAQINKKGGPPLPFAPHVMLAHQ
jgi:hypothetical protein